MKLSTEVSIKPLDKTISYGDKIVFLGSCFADEVGTICKNIGFDALINPFGTLFNPISISNAINRLSSATLFCHNEVIEVGDGEFCCTFQHNTEFWSKNANELMARINKDMEANASHFAKTKWIVVSLGTTWVYKHIASQQVVSNCHKLPSYLFERFRLSTDATTNILKAFVEHNTDKEFIFTVSPLRHLRDGLHENQLSKSTLLLAVDEVCRKSVNAHYFPAYEILLDELRDYRFYKTDMMHPTEQAVQYIWERFTEYAISSESRKAMKEAEILQTMTRHKPMFPESKHYQVFKEHIETKTAELRDKFPGMITTNIK